MKIIGMIPARMGSQRLKQKNLREIDGTSLLAMAARKCKNIPEFDEVWVNSEHETLGKIAEQEGVYFHKRPEELANNQATSEDFIYEFLSTHECDYIFQVHSIAPLLTEAEIKAFVDSMINGKFDVQLSVVLEQIECAMKNQPVNFKYNEKTNSQELEPIQRIIWSITGWKRSTFINAYEQKQCATYAGNVNYFPISRIAGHIIKREEDLFLAEVIYRSMTSSK